MILCCREAGIPGHFFTYLDEKLTILSSWSHVERVLGITSCADATVSPSLNLIKCWRIFICTTMHARKIPRACRCDRLEGIPYKTSEKDIGTDITVSLCTFRSSASRRRLQPQVSYCGEATWYSTECSSMSRCVCTVVYNAVDLRKVNSNASYVLNTHRNANARSRNMRHLLGPVVGRTCSIAASISFWAQLINRGFQKRVFNREWWLSHWPYPNRMDIGILRQPLNALGE